MMKNVSYEVSESTTQHLVGVVGYITITSKSLCPQLPSSHLTIFFNPVFKYKNKKIIMASHGKQCSCGAHRSTPSVHQTLDEMDFERGIWSAALDGDLERVRSLLQKGTDPNMKDQAGYTALHYASRAAHQSVCELLLDHGACANSQTHGGATALHRAAYCGHINVVKLLLNRGANPGLTDDDGSTPLHKAAEQGHLETCVVLVNRCPVLKTTKDKKSRLPVDLSPDHSTFSELLTPPR